MTETLPSGEGITLLTTTSLYPSPDSEPDNELAAGEQVFPTGHYSNQLYPRPHSQHELLEPYMEVRTTNGKTHWIYAAPYQFALGDSSQQWQWRNRIHALLGESEAKNYELLNHAWQSTPRSGALLLHFQATRRLRFALQEALKPYHQLSPAANTTTLPGCEPYLNDEHLSWWIDYNQWADKAAQLPDNEATEALLRFYQQRVYLPDGIEYFHTAWQFPVQNGEVHSLLGRGQHLALLLQLDELFQAYPFVEAEWKYLADQLLNDICEAANTYWESLPEVKQEIAQILEQDQWALLSENDLNRLRRRQHQLDQLEESSALFGWRGKD